MKRIIFFTLLFFSLMIAGSFTTPEQRRELIWDRVMADGTPNMLAGWDANGNPAEVESNTATPAGSTNAIQTNSSGTFGAGNMAVLTNSVYNLTAGQNWHLGWNASGTSGAVDVRTLTVGALGIAIGGFLTDPLTSLHVEKSISGSGSGGSIGEALRLRATYNAVTPLVGSGVGMNFESETSDNNYEVGAVIETVTTDITAASEDFDLLFKTMSGGTAATERMRITSDGRIIATFPTSCTGEASGTIWSDAGTLKVCP